MQKQEEFIQREKQQTKGQILDKKRQGQAVPLYFFNPTAPHPAHWLHSVGLFEGNGLFISTYIWCHRWIYLQVSSTSSWA